ncbi:MAG: ATP-binding cassette domain-containing protein [Bacteroidetes bacterium]|nr:ATP-binding cassette domain-containing protein [Bacteroidota bacterium]
MLTINNLAFSYPTQPVFADLNVNLEPGEFSFLIGKSGSGKSTLLQLIYMNLLPDTGEVNVAGYSSRNIKPKELPFLRRKLGVIFQDFKLFRDRNIYENISFVLEATGISKKEMKKKLNDALTDVGLFHRRFSMPNELSGGEKQRVAIARAIVNEPVLILADEPTGNLDPETANEILDILMKIHNRGTAILFATHNYEIVKRFPMKIYKIEDGKALKGVIKQK